MKRFIIVHIWILMFLLCVITDQGLKQYVINKIKYGDSLNILKDYIYILPVKNRGINISYFNNKRCVFIVLILTVFGIFFYVVLKKYNTNFKIAIMFIVAGITGNFIDFIFKGIVTDFIVFSISGITFPNFNIADLFIVVGVIALIYYVVGKYKILQ